jgi:hypothetical protein
MTTERSYKRFMFGSMAGFIIFGFVLGAVFPSLSGLFFLGMALVGGAVILLIGRRMARQSVDALSDERGTRNFERAAGLTYRVTLAATMLVAIVLLSVVPAAAADLVAAGRALMLVAIAQSLFMTTVYLVIDRKTR